MTAVAVIPRLIDTKKGGHMVGMSMHPWRARLLAALLLSVFPLVGAAAQGGGGVIRGMVFLDDNQDGVSEAGETPLEGVTIIISGGERVIQLLSTSDGSFRTDVPEGEWQGVLIPPEGFLPTNDTTRDVTLSPDGILEAVMDFGLIRSGSGQGDPAAPAEVAPEGELGNGAPEAEAAEEIGQPGDEGSAEAVEEAGQENELGTKEAHDDSVLPLSGSSRPLVLLMAGLGLAGAAGLALIRIGRRLH